MLYFGYASNMDELQMADRCPGATIVDGAVLADHRFVIAAEGYANVLPAPGEVVFGLLWQITPADEAALDHYEGVRPGLYRKEQAEVTTTGGKSVRALIYLASDTALGRPRPGYLEQVVAAARRHHLPGDYITRLEGWFSGPS